MEDPKNFLVHPSVESVKILELKPNDILLVKLYDDADEVAVTKIRDGFKKLLDRAGLNNEIAVYAGDVEVSVLRQGESL